MIDLMKLFNTEDADTSGFFATCYYWPPAGPMAFDLFFFLFFFTREEEEAD